MEEVKLESTCCKAEVDFVGGGYDGEVIVPVSQVCKKCGSKCGVIRVVPEGYEEVEAPF